MESGIQTYKGQSGEYDGWIGWQVVAMPLGWFVGLGAGPLMATAWKMMRAACWPIRCDSVIVPAWPWASIEVEASQLQFAGESLVSELPLMAQKCVCWVQSDQGEDHCQATTAQLEEVTATGSLVLLSPSAAPPASLASAVVASSSAPFVRSLE